MRFCAPAGGRGDRSSWRVRVWGCWPWAEAHNAALWGSEGLEGTGGDPSSKSAPRASMASSAARVLYYEQLSVEALLGCLAAAASCSRVAAALLRRRQQSTTSPLKLRRFFMRKAACIWSRSWARLRSSGWRLACGPPVTSSCSRTSMREIHSSAAAGWWTCRHRVTASGSEASPCCSMMPGA